MTVIPIAASLLACHCYPLSIILCFNLHLILMSGCTILFHAIVHVMCSKVIIVGGELYIQIQGPKSVGPMVSRLCGFYCHQ